MGGGGNQNEKVQTHFDLYMWIEYEEVLELPTLPSSTLNLSSWARGQACFQMVTDGGGKGHFTLNSLPFQKRSHRYASSHCQAYFAIQQGWRITHYLPVSVRILDTNTNTRTLLSSTVNQAEFSLKKERAAKSFVSYFACSGWINRFHKMWCVKEEVPQILVVLFICSHHCSGHNLHDMIFSCIWVWHQQLCVGRLCCSNLTIIQLYIIWHNPKDLHT